MLDSSYGAYGVHFVVPGGGGTVSYNPPGGSAAAVASVGAALSAVRGHCRGGDGGADSHAEPEAQVVGWSNRSWRSAPPAPGGPEPQAGDLGEYLRRFTADGYPADVVRHCRCGSCNDRGRGGHDFDLAVPYSLRPSGDVRWITIGVRCVACGVLGAVLDWPVYYARSRHLVNLA